MMREDSALRSVVGRLAELYNPEETRVWLHAEHRHLSGERAIDLIHQVRADEVLTVIEGLGQDFHT